MCSAKFFDSPRQYCLQFLAPLLYMNVRITLHSLLITFPKYHAKLSFQLHPQNLVDCPVYGLHHTLNWSTATDCHIVSASSRNSNVWTLFFFFLSLKIIFKNTPAALPQFFCGLKKRGNIQKEFHRKERWKDRKYRFQIEYIYTYVYTCVCIYICVCIISPRGMLPCPIGK